MWRPFALIALLGLSSPPAVAEPEAHVQLSAKEAKALIRTHLESYKDLVLSRARLNEDELAYAQEQLYEALYASARVEGLDRMDEKISVRVLDGLLATGGVAIGTGGLATSPLVGGFGVAAHYMNMPTTSAVLLLITSGMLYLSPKMIAVSTKLLLQSAFNLPVKDRLAPKIQREMKEVTKLLARDPRRQGALEAHLQMIKLVDHYVEFTKAMRLTTEERCNILLSTEARLLAGS